VRGELRWSRLLPSFSQEALRLEIVSSLGVKEDGGQSFVYSARSLQDQAEIKRARREKLLLRRGPTGLESL